MCIELLMVWFTVFWSISWFVIFTPDMYFERMREFCLRLVLGSKVHSCSSFLFLAARSASSFSCVLYCWYSKISHFFAVLSGVRELNDLLPISILSFAVWLMKLPLTTSLKVFSLARYDCWRFSRLLVFSRRILLLYCSASLRDFGRVLGLNVCFSTRSSIWSSLYFLWSLGISFCKDLFLLMRGSDILWFWNYCTLSSEASLSIFWPQRELWMDLKLWMNFANGRTSVEFSK